MNSDVPFNVNRAIIQKGETRMMVYYWFQQGDRRVAWDVAAKFHLMMDGIHTGETDGAIRESAAGTARRTTALSLRSPITPRSRFSSPAARSRWQESMLISYRLKE